MHAILGKDLEAEWDRQERERLLAEPVPPLTKERLEQLVEDALAILADSTYPWDRPGLRGELTRIVKIGLRVLTRIEFAKPPEVSGTWDNYLTSADILSEIREHHVARFEQSRRAAVSSVGRLPVLSYTLGD